MQNVSTINLNGAFIYLMEVKPENLLEYQEKLTFQEITRLKTIQHPNKKLEFCASRYLKHLFFGNEEISYLEHGTPILEQTSTRDGKHFTISHSKQLTAIGIHNQHPFAIDLEQITDKAKRLSIKFCNEDEKRMFNTESDKEMTLLWSMKEVLYKLSDRNGLDFRRDITVEKDLDGYRGSVLLSAGLLQVELQHFEINGFYLTCNQSYTLLHADS